MQKYNHRQTGWVIIGATALVMGLVFLSIREEGFFSLFLILEALILLLFSTLTVNVDDEYVRIRFGIGLIRKRFALKDITSCGTIKTKWYSGWGIHGCPGKGWLFNVSGFDAIGLTMKDGKKYYIGTDEPEKLFQVINGKINT